MHQRRQIRKEQPEIHKDKPINGSLPELHSQNASLIHNEERDIDKDKPINRSLSALHSQRFLIHNESSRKPATCIVKLYGTKNCESTLRQTINHSAPTKYMLSGAEKKIQSAWLGGYCGPVIFEDDDKYLRRDDFTCNSGCCTWSWDLANDVKSVKTTLVKEAKYCSAVTCPSAHPAVKDRLCPDDACGQLVCCDGFSKAYTIPQMSSIFVMVWLPAVLFRISAPSI